MNVDYRASYFITISKRSLQMGWKSATTWHEDVATYVLYETLFDQTAPKHSKAWDEADSGDSGDSAFQYQVKTDTLRLGRSNKTQTNKPINTFEAQHTSFH